MHKSPRNRGVALHVLSFTCIEEIFTVRNLPMNRTLLVFGMTLLACCTALAQRLPGGATPEHYTLSFNINFSNNTFEGDETIAVKLARPSKTITLNAVEIDFHEVTITA